MLFILNLVVNCNKNSENSKECKLDSDSGIEYNNSEKIIKMK